MRLEITRKSDLAVLALGQLAARPTAWKAGELAAAIGTTPGFLSQVLSPLVRAGWVQSGFGPTGGYRHLEAAPAPTLLDVIEAIEGPTRSDRCALRRATHCAGRTDGTECALHTAWLRAREALIAVLAATPVLRPRSEGRPVNATPR